MGSKGLFELKWGVKTNHGITITLYLSTFIFLSHLGPVVWLESCSMRHSFQNWYVPTLPDDLNKKTVLDTIVSWLKSVISDKVKRYEAGAEIYYNSVYYFRHAYYEQVSRAWCNNLCTQSPGDPNEAITWKANIVKRLCLKL